MIIISPRRLGIVLMLVGALLLYVSGCVPKQEKVEVSVCTDKICSVIYKNKDGQKQLIYIEKARFGNCEPGKRWPNCTEGDISRGMRNIPYNANPNVKTNQHQVGRDAKTVCVSSVSHPEVTITNTWFIGEMAAKTEDPDILGIFQRCAIGLPGQTAYIKSEHHAAPSTVMCNVFWVTADGDRIVLDFVITQAMGDCQAQAVIP